MDVLHKIIYALWNHNLDALANPDIIWIVYGIMFLTLLLENGLLPASFLPGDSLLLLAGAMIAKGIMNFIPTILILTTAASLGYWLSYLQGRWLNNTKIVKKWLIHLPSKYHQQAWKLFNNHGLISLLIVRFIAFVRTLLPIIVGIAGLQEGRFQIFNWISGLLWVTILLTIGYGFNQIPFIKRHEDQVMVVLMLLPIILFIIGLTGSLILIWKIWRS